MKRLLLLIFFLATFTPLFCQITDAEEKLKAQIADSIYGWKRGGVINLSTAQTSLTNWGAGGQSSFSVNGLTSLFARNKKDKSLWENYFNIGFGSVRQKEAGWRKTDDRVDFTSKYGLKSTEKLYYAALLNFKTQMTPGYNYPNDSVKISDFFAPAYLIIAAGMDYVPSPDFTIYLSPFTYRLTIVNDDALADAGSFGVNPGDHTKSEFGGYMRTFFKKELMENIALQTKLELFSDYLENFGNIDVSWETLLALKVNKYISVTLATHLLYDDDVTIQKEQDGVIKEYNSKIQFKEVLAVGFLVNF